MSVLSTPDFEQWLRREGAARYHAKHPFHARMHEGTLSKDELRSWVVNRYYYQTRIPIKDAIILSKSDDPSFRRAWIRRIVDHDGSADSEDAVASAGGLALWERLGEACDVPVAELREHRRVHPGVRFACDAYVTLVRERSLVEAVASSLTEFFAPDLMSARIDAWERHYPWIGADALAYFRSRVPRATRDSGEALAFVLEHARTAELQRACVRALVCKTEILWHLLDCLGLPR